MFKRWLISGVAVLVLVGGVVGMVMAQEPQPPVDSPAEVCPFDGECPLDDGTEGFEHGPMGHRGHHGRYGSMGSAPELLAEALGLTVEELTAALAEGTTIAELATAQDVELADVAAELVAPRIEAIETAVVDGSLTQEQADVISARMEEGALWMLEQGFGHDGDRGSHGSGGCPMSGSDMPDGTTPGGFMPLGGMRGRGHRHNTAPQPQWNAPSS